MYVSMRLLDIIKWYLQASNILPNTRHCYKLYSAQYYPISMWTARTDLDYC